MIGISYCICTFNRANQLRDTLRTFVQLSDLLSTEDELLIIDNNSKDHTQSVIKEFSELLPIRPFLEKKQGLANARNCALQRFKSDIIVFFDDDITVSAAALKTYKGLLKKYLDISFFGGRIEVDWRDNKPAWLQANDLVLLNGLFGKYDLGDQNTKYQAQSLLPFGANFALRRTLVEKVGLFNAKLGVVGEQIGRGEETDYFQRAIFVGESGMYLATAQVGHRFQSDRIKTSYLFRYGIEKGRAAQYLSSLNKTDASYSLLFSLLSYVAKGIYQWLKGRRDRYYQCVINIGIVYHLLKHNGAGKSE